MKLTETFLVRSVPHVHKGVRSSSGEGSVLFVESDGIDRENVLHFLFFRSMAFECVFFLLNFRIGIEEFHGHATCRRRSSARAKANADATSFTFDRTENVTLFVREATNASRLIFQIRFAIVDRRLSSDRT